MKLARGKYLNQPHGLGVIEHCLLPGSTQGCQVQSQECSQQHYHQCRCLEIKEQATAADAALGEHWHLPLAVQAIQDHQDAKGKCQGQCQAQKLRQAPKQDGKDGRRKQLAVSGSVQVAGKAGDDRDSQEDTGGPQPLEQSFTQQVTKKFSQEIRLHYYHRQVNSYTP